LHVRARSAHPSLSASPSPSPPPPVLPLPSPSRLPPHPSLPATKHLHSACLPPPRALARPQELPAVYHAGQYPVLLENPALMLASAFSGLFLLLRSIPTPPILPRFSSAGAPRSVQGLYVPNFA
jgi:hypothetical protein